MRHRFILDSVCLAKVDLLTEHALGRVLLNAMNSADYSAIYAAAGEAQHQGVQWATHESACSLAHRCAVVFDPDCLSGRAAGLEITKQTWHCKAPRSSVMLTHGPCRFSWYS
jgi:hypothetical protein